MYSEMVTKMKFELNEEKPPCRHSVLSCCATIQGDRHDKCLKHGPYIHLSGMCLNLFSLSCASGAMWSHSESYWHLLQLPFRRTSHSKLSFAQTTSWKTTSFMSPLYFWQSLGIAIIGIPSKMLKLGGVIDIIMLQFCRDVWESAWSTNS